MEICEMGGVRENCRVMEKAKYWTELEPTIHKFFKFMVPGFRTQLRIPKKFTRNFREELPETLSLRGPSGSTWRVCVSKRNEEMLLCCGWNRFVEEHQLQESDVLVFQYAGDSTFRVEIFEIGGCCEREGAYFVNQHSRACSDDFCILQKVREEAEEIRQLEWTDGEDESDKIVEKRGRRRNGVERHGAAAESGAECLYVSDRLRSTSARRKNYYEGCYPTTNLEHPNI